jgi:hypothetical protein
VPQTHDRALRSLSTTLSTSPHLRKYTIRYGSGNGVHALVRSLKREMLHLVETEETWLVVAEEIQRGLCRIEGSFSIRLLLSP